MTRSSKLAPQPTAKGNHASRVAHLFDELQSLSNPSSSDERWLQVLRDDALRKAMHWKAHIARYVQRLHVEGRLTSDQVDNLRKLAMACHDGDPGWEPLLVPLAWGIAVSGVATTWQFLHWSRAALGLLAAIMIALAARWASVRLLPPRSKFSNLRAWQRWVGIGVIAAGSTLVMMTFSLVVHNVARGVSTRQFVASNSALMQSDSAFATIKDLALQHYGITVVLGDAHESWGSTALAFPGASVASIELRPGYCTLSIYPEDLLRSFEPGVAVPDKVWLEGVMAHELAHCLDISRDLPGFASQTVGSHSIAPIDATAVHDLNSYVVASKRLATRQWREGLSDTFAIGFWRLTVPGHANALAMSLRNKRTDASQSDKAHATACWIDQAMSSAPPASLADLLAWSDRQRASAACTFVRLK